MTIAVITAPFLRAANLRQGSSNGYASARAGRLTIGSAALAERVAARRAASAAATRRDCPLRVPRTQGWRQSPGACLAPRASAGCIRLLDQGRGRGVDDVGGGDERLDTGIGFTPRSATPAATKRPRRTTVTSHPPRPSGRAATSSSIVVRARTRCMRHRLAHRRDPIADYRGCS